jgi:hypothetical protein
MIPGLHGDLEGKTGPVPFFSRLLCVLVIRCHEIHDLVRGNPQVNELLEDKIIEDEPREIRAVEETIVLAKGLLEVFEGAAAEGAFAPYELIEKDLFLAPRTRGVRGLHA